MSGGPPMNGPTENRSRRVRGPMLISVVAPLFNEEGIAEEFYGRVKAALGDYPLEIVLVDDGSTDGTADILAELAARDDHVAVISLSRNFGHQAAITAGLDHARGDVIVIMDADLQDPP